MKGNLISSLKRAIHALEKDIVHYDWTMQSSCNAGVVAQCVLEIDAKELDFKRDKVFSKLEEIIDNDTNGLLFPEKRSVRTWKNAVKFTCPITGKNMPQIFKDLEAAGLSVVDIVHLEYLDNPAILAESTIEKISVTKEVVVDVIETKRIKKKFFGLFKKIEIVKEEVKETHTDFRYPSKYYSKKENLIKYLSAWVRILEKKNKEFSLESEKIEAAILEAVAEEKYELAASLRDKLLKSY